MGERGDGDCAAITTRILIEWGKQKSLTEIAQELDLDLKIVKEILKRAQKKEVAEQRGASYGKGSKG